MPIKPTVILDPYLLVSLADRVPAGALSSCDAARFALCNHLPAAEFHSAEFDKIQQTVAREDIDLLPVEALEMADLLCMRSVLALHQVASIAAARSLQCFFASDCDVFRRMAEMQIRHGRVLCGPDVCRQFSLN